MPARTVTESSNRKSGKSSVPNAKNLLMIGIVLALCVYVGSIFIKQRISMAESEALKNEILQKTATEQLKQQMLQDELRKAEDNPDEYMERAAREKLGLVKPNERIFYDISQE